MTGNWENSLSVFADYASAFSITQIPCIRCTRWMTAVTVIGRDGDGEDEEENRLSVRVKVLVATCEINDANRLSSRVKE